VHWKGLSISTNVGWAQISNDKEWNQCSTTHQSHATDNIQFSYYQTIKHFQVICSMQKNQHCQTIWQFLSSTCISCKNGMSHAIVYTLSNEIFLDEIIMSAYHTRHVIHYFIVIMSVHGRWPRMSNQHMFVWHGVCVSDCWICSEDVRSSICFVLKMFLSYSL